MAVDVFGLLFLLLIGAGLLTVLVGVGVVVFLFLRKKQEPRGFEVLPKK